MKSLDRIKTMGASMKLPGTALHRYTPVPTFPTSLAARGYLVSMFWPKRHKKESALMF